MYPQILWELVADPLESTEHTLGTTALYQLYYHSSFFHNRYFSEVLQMNCLLKTVHVMCFLRPYEFHVQYNMTNNNCQLQLLRYWQQTSPHTARYARGHSWRYSLQVYTHTDLGSYSIIITSHNSLILWSVYCKEVDSVESFTCSQQPSCTISSLLQQKICVIH